MLILTLWSCGTQGFCFSLIRNIAFGSLCSIEHRHSLVSRLLDLFDDLYVRLLLVKNLDLICLLWLSLCFHFLNLRWSTYNLWR